MGKNSFQKLLGKVVLQKIADRDNLLEMVCDNGNGENRPKK